MMTRQGLLRSSCLSVIAIAMLPAVAAAQVAPAMSDTAVTTDPAAAQTTPAPANTASGNTPRTVIVEPTGTPGTAGQDILVVGIRGSVASAANMKRTAKQIVDSVVAEDAGKLPDNNVPEALSRVTGVQITRERGQGQAVSIRGLSQVQTTVNGNNTNLGDGRSINLADIPAELLKSVDVYKTRTADQVEGGIAGTVNVQLRRPLDLKKGFTAAGSVRGSYDDISKKVSPYTSILLADRFDTGIGEMGFLVNGSFTRNNYFENYVESESPDTPCCEGDANSPFASLPANLRNIVIPYRANYGLESGFIKRPSLNVAGQWRASDSLDFVLEGSYLGSRERRSSSRLFLQAREFGSTFSNIALAPDGRTVTGLTVNNPNGVPGGVDSIYDNRKSNLYTSNFETHWRSDRAQVNASVQYNRSNEGNYDVEQVLRFRNQTSANVVFNSDQVPGGAPLIDFGAGRLADINNYTVDRFQDLTGGSRNKEFAGQIDVTLKLSEASLLRSLQTGFRFNTRDTSRYYGYRDGLPRINGQAVPLSAFPGGDRAVLTSPRIRGATTPAWFQIPGKLLYDNVADALRYIQATDPADADRFASALPPSDRGQTFTSKESSIAGYAQLNYAFELGFPIDGVAGVRYTNTYGTSRSFEFRPGTAANGFEDIVNASSGSGNYVDILPSLNAIVHFTPKMQLRLAYTTNVSRPSFYDMRPFFVVEANIANPGVYAGNPNLKAQREHSFDASLEYYFGRAGTVSVAGYYKKASGFLYYSRQTDQDLTPYGIVGRGFIEQQRNAGDGTFAGVEVAGQTFFDFLPGVLKNFGVSANGTYVGKARIEYPYPEDFPGAFDSPDTSKWTANAAIYYDTPTFSARVAYNYRSGYRLGVFTDNPEYSPYNGVTSRLDAAVNYTPVKFLTLSVEGSNLLCNNVHRYFGQQKLLPLGVRTLARTVQGSARFRF